MRFQQLTGPRWPRASRTRPSTATCGCSANEVGGDPRAGRDPPEALHAAAARAQDAWPAAMLASSTHDTKRSEDVRARIALLSEIPERWASASTRGWRGWRPSATRWSTVPTAYLVYQTLVRRWPIDEDRLWRYVEKALREAKLRTSWTAPDAAYEGAVACLRRGAWPTPSSRDEVDAFVARACSRRGRSHALAQTLLKLTLPGVPDIYQGTELWDLSPGRPGQPPTGRLRAAAQRSCRRSRRARRTRCGRRWTVSTDRASPSSG